jgi:DNA replicative helicase MCM subunit Mcm2 (Cdc46/Mcm family)
MLGCTTANTYKLLLLPLTHNRDEERDRSIAKHVMGVHINASTAAGGGGTNTTDCKFNSMNLASRHLIFCTASYKSTGVIRPAIVVMLLQYCRSITQQALL